MTACFLQFAVVYGSRERNDVTDVAHTGQIHHAALESETESRMSCRTVLAQIKVELVVLFLESQLVDSCKELIVVVLSLASTDDLADARNETVNGCNRLSILVQFHVERLDLLRIIGYEYRTLVDLLGQVALMLGLQITAP